MLSAPASAPMLADAVSSTACASAIASLDVWRVVPPFCTVIASDSIVAERRVSELAIRAWSAASRSSRLRAAKAPRTRATAITPAISDTGQSEHEHSRSEPSPVEPKPFHAEMVRVPGPRRTAAATPRGPLRSSSSQQEVLVERIAFVGLGTMGAAMAANLRRAGFEVTVWNRTPGRAADLVALGAVEAATPADAARAADVVVTCVSDTPDVDAVLFGPDGVADGPGRRRPRHRLLHDLAGGDRRVCRAPRGSGAWGSWTRRSRAGRRARRTRP